MSELLKQAIADNTAMAKAKVKDLESKRAIFEKEIEGLDPNEVGRHEELLRREGGIYCRLHELQFAAEELTT